MRLHRFLVARAGQGQRIGVVVAIQQLRKQSQRHADRLRLFLLNAGESLLAQPLKFGFRETGFRMMSA